MSCIDDKWLSWWEIPKVEQRFYTGWSLKEFNLLFFIKLFDLKTFVLFSKTRLGLDSVVVA